MRECESQCEAANPAQTRISNFGRAAADKSENERQEHDAADSQRLKRQGRATEEDRKKAENLEEAGHFEESGTNHGKRDLATSDVPVGGEHLPAQAVVAGSQVFDLR